MRKKETLIESSIETSMESPIESPTESRPIEKRKISRTGTLTRARVLWCLAAAGCGLWNVYHAVMTERGTQNAGDQDILYPGHRGERAVPQRDVLRKRRRQAGGGVPVHRGLAAPGL